MENNTAMRDFFTETEWDAIFDAICEFQDHGEEEAELSHQIQLKISKLFNIGNINNWGITMWDEIQDMQGEIFDIRDDDLMDVFADDLKEDFDQDTKKLLAQFWNWAWALDLGPFRGP